MTLPKLKSQDTVLLRFQLLPIDGDIKVAVITSITNKTRFVLIDPNWSSVFYYSEIRYRYRLT